jgi:ribosomal protein S19
MKKRGKRTTAGDKTICQPIAEGQDYSVLVNDTKAFRAYLDKQIETHPELFPKGIEQGYCLHGFVESQRLEMRTRRLRLKSNRQAYQLRPDTVMPYMVGMTQEVEKGLYFRRYGVPYEGIAHVLGHSAMFWWRATQGLARASIVGSTVKDPEALPP